ncbi:MAG: TAXI family TRAP transporter solute-binding subunit [Deltaproteobacteria bacterium]|nr:TAXI family TRAP transporter solute-binding subunit [Candidatus Tharpella aukensis]
MRFDKNNFTRSSVALFTGMFLIVTGAIAEEPKVNFITIGTGSRNGIYYPVGRAISAQVNQHRKRHGLRCSVESTHGSVYNLSVLHLGEFELCLSQSDQLVDAYKGESSFAEQEPFQELRTLFSLYMEPLTVITRKEDNLCCFADLKHKRVYIGQPGSGNRATVAKIMKQFAWNLDDIHEPAANLELTTTQSLRALCKHEIDAVMLIIGHPYPPLAEAAATCALEIMEITGTEIDKLVEAHPSYYDTIIPGALYPDNLDSVKSIGVVATLVSASTVDNEIIYQVVKSLFEQLERFKTAHPRLKNLTIQGMSNHKLAVPLHNGAIRYYVEAGLIK